MALANELLNAIFADESGGNTQSYNASGNAMGKYQFQQGTWNGAAKMAAREDLVDVDPRNASEEDQDAVALAYANHLLEKGGNDPAYVAAAWYEGEDTALEHQKAGHYPTHPETYDGDDTIYPSVQEYVNSKLEKLGMPTTQSRNPVDFVSYNTSPDVDYKAMDEARGVGDSFFTKAKNSFVNAYYDSPIGGAVRATWLDDVYNTNKLATPFTVTQADVDFVKSRLPDDKIAQNYVLFNAESTEHMNALLYQKEQDAQRQEKLEQYGLGVHSVAALAGSVLGDPLTLLPLGQEAVVVKALGRMGTLGKLFATSKIAKYAEIAASNALLNVASAKGAEVAGGFKQDYETAAVFGGIAGGALSATGDLLRYSLGKAGKKVAGVLDSNETKGIRALMGMNPEGLRPLRAVLKPLHDASFAIESSSKYLKDLVSNESVYVVSKNNLSEIGAAIGRSISPTAKAFYDPLEKVGIIVKDNLVKGDKIDNLLAHEVGVHANLNAYMGDKAYNGLMDTVRKNIAKPPNKAWEDAVRATPGGGPEEVLGAWIEKARLKDATYQRVKSGMMSMMRDAGLDVKLSDTEIKSMVKGSMENASLHGIQELPDGSVMMGGLKYSDLNPLNPHVYSALYDLETHLDTQKDIPKLGGNSILQRFTKSLEAGWFFGNNHGIGRNSVSKTLKDFASTATIDPRLREFKGTSVMPLESIKADTLQQLHGAMEAWYAVRNKFIYGTPDVEGIKGIAQIPKTLVAPVKAYDFNKQFVQAYNYTFGNVRAGVTPNWAPEIMEAVSHFKKTQDLIEEIGLHSSQRYGSLKTNLLDKPFGPRKEFYRVTDAGSLSDFIRKFPTAEDAVKYLQEYGYKIADRSAHYADYLRKREEAFSELELAYKEKRAAWEARNGKGKRPVAPKQKELPKDYALLEGSDKAVVEDYIRKEADKWGLGQVDKNKSNLAYLRGEVKDDNLPFFRERFAGDTSTVVDLPSGEKFSFDNNLRSYDVDFITERVFNRFSGEVAAKTRYNDVAKGILEERVKIEKELGNALKMRDITPSQMKKELGVYDDTIANLRGYKSRNDVRGKWDAISGIVRNLVYAERSGNFGFNQIGENGGSLGYMGFRAALYSIPKLDDMYRAAKTGRLQADLVKEVKKHVWGGEMASKIWSKNDVEYRLVREASTRGDIGQNALDAIGTGTNHMGRIASTFNGLLRTTQNQVEGIRSDTMVDSLDWAFGKKFSSIRNPFSSKKLEAAGITPKIAKGIKEDIQKYASKGVEGQFTGFNVDSWMRENPTNYYKWKFMVDNQVDRCLTQNTAGNRNWLKDANWATRMFFQFKDFSLKAVNSQTMRALSSREIDDALSAIGSMTMNAGVYIALTNARAYAYFPNDKSRRQLYLDDRLKPSTVASAAFLRGAITGAFFGFGRDAYEAATGAQSFRTTVDRTGSFKKEKTMPEIIDGMNSSKAIGDTISQLPAISTVANASESAWDLTHSAFSKNRNVSKSDLKQLYRSMPMNSFLPLVYMSNVLINKTHIPEKQPAKRR